MKHLLLTTIAAVVLVGCGESQQSRQWSEADSTLFAAADEGNIEAVKQAIAAGADVNTKDESLMTPLHWATVGGHKEVAVLLIAKGADVNAKDSRRWTPLHRAASDDHNMEIVELLIAKGAEVNAKDDTGDTPLDEAINNGEYEIIKLLRKHGGKTGEELKAEGE
jgi:ankyrin repeat protein